jgi:hypothetical protein
MGSERQAELQQLAQAMMSGDPAARQAAVQRLHEIRAQRLAELTGQQGAPGPGGQQHAAGPGGQYAAGPQAGYGAQGAPSWAGGTQAAGRPASAEQRLASLEQLRGRGLLTDAEYQAKRQQIINEI